MRRKKINKQKTKNKVLYKNYDVNDFISEVMLFFIKKYDVFDESLCKPRTFIIQSCSYCSGDKYGLGKYDPFYKAHPTNAYLYKFTVLPQISMDKYKGLSPAIAAKRLTDDMRSSIDSVQD